MSLPALSKTILALLLVFLMFGCRCNFEGQHQYFYLAKSCSKDLVKRQIKTIAIAPFVSIDGKYSGWANIITEKFKAELSNRAEFFNISDRSEVHRLLEEYEWRKSGMLREETISKLGDLYSINGVVTGSYVVEENWLGNPKYITVFVKSISLETGISMTFEGKKIPIDF